MGVGAIHLRNNYYKKGVLGKGAFARVWKVQDKKSKKFYAAKSIAKNRLNADERNLVEMEIKILREIHHPHCCNLIEAFESEKKIYLVQELMEGPTLYDRFAQNSTEDITEWHVASCVHKIALALEYLHSKKIVHRDLKPQNIMFALPAETDRSMKTLKLLDFGFAKYINSSGFTSSSRGTPQYVAPEVIFKNKKGRIEYGTSCDMWSLGILIFELMSGTSPFERKRNLAEFFKHVRRDPIKFPIRYWEGASDEVKELVLGLLEKNPKRRLNAKQVLKHPWIKENCGQFEKSYSARSRGRASIKRAKNVKTMVGRLKFLRGVHYVILMARIHWTMDTLLDVCLGTRVDLNLKQMLNEALTVTTTEIKDDEEQNESKFRLSRHRASSSPTGTMAKRHHRHISHLRRVSMAAKKACEIKMLRTSADVDSEETSMKDTLRIEEVREEC